jgi:hypothetical protein
MKGHIEKINARQGMGERGAELPRPVGVHHPLGSSTCSAIQKLSELSPLQSLMEAS